ncbi:TPA: hypothetical protein NPN74_004819 [Klebsiella quasipneumoniae subsp. quasipneumoniae]|nr:hypothetical protein [Klebsiella quasipneumoniae subsp. quasipneumoniae]
MPGSRTYPEKRRARGDAKKANLLLISVRVEESLSIYIKEQAMKTGLSKQDIIDAAIKLHMKYCSVD